MHFLQRFFGNTTRPSARDAGEDEALLGFRPAFLDSATCAIYVSRHQDGRPAAFHTIEGLPDEVVRSRWSNGRIANVKPTLVAGYERNGFFYTHKAAARAVADWPH